MNFKTTLALIVCLIAVGLIVFFTRNESGKPPEKSQAPAKYIDIPSADVTKVIITPASDPKIVLQRDGTQWRLVEPFNAPADFDAADGLVQSLSSLDSHGTVDASGSDAKVTGLDHPNYKVEIDEKDGQSIKLDVGNPTGVGDDLYVRKDGEQQIYLVPAGLYEQLNKPASGFRDMKLVDAQSDEIRSVDIKNADGKNLSLSKVGDNWQINTGPTTMPADQASVSDVLFAITGLRANEYINEKPSDLKRYGLDDPSITVTYNVHPTTQPTLGATTTPTTEPAEKTEFVKFGRPVDMRKEEYFAMTSSNGGEIAKVPASTTQPFDKTPLDLRNKEVVSISPPTVETISIQTKKPATTEPTKQPASETTITIARNKEVPVKPWRAPFVAPGQNATTAPASTQPTTSPSDQLKQEVLRSLHKATTQPASEPTAHPTTVASTQPTTAPAPAKWLITSAPAGNADESTVQGLLDMLNPLRAEKYDAKSPIAKPAAQYTLTITTAGESPKTYVITLADPGSASTQNPVAQYEGLTFEVTRPLLDKLSGKFEASEKPANTAEH